MVCEILCVGTEILLGDIVNTNAAYIARELAMLGIYSYRQSVVGDNPERLRDSVKDALMRSDIVIMTGGLGPTCDDITKKVVADVFGQKMYFSEEIKNDIEKMFEKLGRKMTENNLSQAYVPEGAKVLYNKWGTAPGLIISGEIEGQMKHAVLLPGPPSECEPMFDEYVKEYLGGLSNCVIYSLNLHVYGIGESGAEQILRPLMEESKNPTVAPYACEHEVRIRITATSSDYDEAIKMCSEMDRRICDTEVGQYVYARSDNPTDAKNSIVNTLIHELRKNKTTICTAESCTAGMIAARLGDIPGVSDVFEGGIVSYSNDVKQNVLKVPGEVLMKHGAVSEECAAAMAEGALKAVQAGIAISVTGIAGPGGGTPEKPVGTVCFGVADSRGIYTETKRFGGKNDRSKIRRLTTARAMILAIKRLRNEI